MHTPIQRPWDPRRVDARQPARPSHTIFAATTTATTQRNTHAMQAAPSATQAKDKNYMLLGHSLARLSRAVGQTADLCAQLRANLDAMKGLAATHAAQ